MTQDQIQKVKDSLTQEDIDKLTEGIASDVTDLKAFRDMVKNMVKENGELCLGGKCIKSFNEITPPTPTKTSILGTHHTLGPHSHFNHPNGQVYIRPSKEKGNINIGDLWQNKGGNVQIGNGAGLIVNKDKVTLRKPSYFEKKGHFQEGILVDNKELRGGDIQKLKNLPASIPPPQQIPNVTPTSLFGDNLTIGRSQMKNKSQGGLVLRPGEVNKTIYIGDDEGKTKEVIIGGYGKGTNPVRIGPSTFYYGNDKSVSIQPASSSGEVKLKAADNHDWSSVIKPDYFHVGGGAIKSNQHKDILINSREKHHVKVGDSLDTNEVELGHNKAIQIKNHGGGNIDIHKPLWLNNKITLKDGKHFCVQENGKPDKCYSSSDLRIGKFGQHTFLNHDNGNTYIRSAKENKDVLIGDHKSQYVHIGLKGPTGIQPVSVTKDSLIVRKELQPRDNICIQNPKNSKDRVCMNRVDFYHAKIAGNRIGSKAGGNAHIPGTLEVDNHICIVNPQNRNDKVCMNRIQFHQAKQGGNNSPAPPPFDINTTAPGQSVIYMGDDTHVQSGKKDKNLYIGHGNTKNVHLGPNHGRIVATKDNVTIKSPSFFQQIPTLNNGVKMCWEKAGTSRRCLDYNQVKSINDGTIGGTPFDINSSIPGKAIKVLNNHTNLDSVHKDKEIYIGHNGTSIVKIGPSGGRLRVNNNIITTHVNTRLNEGAEIPKTKNLCFKGQSKLFGPDEPDKCLAYDNVNKLQHVTAKDTAQGQVGNSWFNSNGGHAYIRPGKANKDIKIGDALMNVSGDIKIGHTSPNKHTPLIVNKNKVKIGLNSTNNKFPSFTVSSDGSWFDEKATFQKDTDFNKAPKFNKGARIEKDYKLCFIGEKPKNAPAVERCLNYKDVQNIQKMGDNKDLWQGQFGRSYFNRYDGHTYIRANKDKQNIIIGDNAGMKDEGQIKMGFTRHQRQTPLIIEKNEVKIGTNNTANSYPSLHVTDQGNWFNEKATFQKDAIMNQKTKMNNDVDINANYFHFRPGDGDGQVKFATNGAHFAERLSIGGRKADGTTKGVFCIGGNCLTEYDIGKIRELIGVSKRWDGASKGVQSWMREYI